MIRVVVFLLLAVVLLSLKSKAVSSTGSIAYERMGKIYFFYPSSNKVLVDRNKIIASALNDYCKKNAPASFPDVLLYLYDQEANLPTNIDELLVGYEKYEGEFISASKVFVSHKRPAVAISVTTDKSHLEWSIAAMKYAVENMKDLKKRERSLAAKKKVNQLTDGDMEVFRLK